MTTQNHINEVNEKAERIRADSDSLLAVLSEAEIESGNGTRQPERKLLAGICSDAIGILIHAGRLQAKQSLAIDALYKIANVDQSAGSEDMRVVASTALQAINE